MLDPLVLVVPQKATPGADTISDIETLRLTPAVPLSQALARHHPTDAHFFLYTFDDPAWARVNKAILAELRAAGHAPTLCVTALDLDTAEHTFMSDQEYTAARVAVLASSPQPRYFHRTTNGARALFIHPPLDPEDQEALHRGLVALFRSQGVYYDPTVDQWNRPFRLPHVLRDGKPTLPQLEDWGHTLDPTTIPRLAKPRRPLDPATLRAPLPSRAFDLCYTVKRGWSPTAWMKVAKQILTGRDARTGLELDPFLAPENVPEVPFPRNSNFMRYVGCATSLLWAVPGTTPAHIFGMFTPAIRSSQKDDGRDLQAEVWKEISWCWASEEAKRAQVQEDQQSLEGQIFAAMKQWPNKPTIPSDPDEAHEWLMRRLVLSVGKVYFALTEHGWYSPTPLLKDHLIAAFNHSPVRALLPEVQTKAGSRTVSSLELLEDHHLPLARGEVSFALEAPSLPEGAGWFDGVTFYRCPYYRRRDISPEFNSDVDEWMRVLFGRHYALVCRWVGLALAFERGPICILSIQGVDSMGKGMFVQGLAECINTQTVAYGESFDKWQYDLDRTPFISIDEGWPEGVAGIADKVRRMVGGCHQMIDKKFLHVEHCESNPRVILTANNPSVVQQLFARKQLTGADLDAVAKRLTHIKLEDTAQAWLARKGQKAFTHGWIADQGVPSKWTVAKHFLWLYEQHGQHGGATRFLMDGKTEPETLWEISLGHGADLEAAYWIGHAANARTGEIDKTGELWLTAEDCVKGYSDKNGGAPWREGVAWFGRRMEPFTLADNRGRRKIDLKKLATAMRSQRLDVKWDVTKICV